MLTKHRHCGFIVFMSMYFWATNSMDFILRICIAAYDLLQRVDRKYFLFQREHFQNRKLFFKMHQYLTKQASKNSLQRKIKTNNNPLFEHLTIVMKIRHILSLLCLNDVVSLCLLKKNSLNDRYSIELFLFNYFYLNIFLWWFG